MGTIAANELKTRGVASISEQLADAPEAIITVRGKKRYVVMEMEHYQYLRECELEAAVLEWGGRIFFSTMIVTVQPTIKLLESFSWLRKAMSNDSRQVFIIS